MAGSLFFAARIIFTRRSYALPKGGEAVARLRGAAALFFPVFFGAALLLFPDVSAAAAREGVALCLQTVLPSLFPFFVLSSLLVQSDVPRLLSRAMAGVMYPLFGVSGAGASALILGLLGGYPVGARTVAELYGRGEIAREEAEQLLAFCNNSGPGFFLGVCGTAVFGSARAGMYLYLIHVGAALVTGVLLRRDLGLPRRKAVSRQRAPFDLAAALPAAVQGSFAAVGSVSAFVIFFMVLLRLLSLVPALAALPPLPRAALFGFVEMTNGVNALPATRTGFVLCAAIMNWGGLSVQAQTRALLAGSALSARRCVIGKAVQALAGVPLALLAAQRLFGKVLRRGAGGAILRVRLSPRPLLYGRKADSRHAEPFPHHRFCRSRAGRLRAPDRKSAREP